MGATFALAITKVMWTVPLESVALRYTMHEYSTSKVSQKLRSYIPFLQSLYRKYGLGMQSPLMVEVLRTITFMHFLSVQGLACPTSSLLQKALK